MYIQLAYTYIVHYAYNWVGVLIEWLHFTHAAVDRLYSASLFYLGRALGDWVVHLVITWDTEVHIRVCYHACMHCIHGLSMLPGFIV